MAKRYEPAAQALEVVGWTARRKGLPYVSARGLGRFHGAIGRALTRMVPEAADGR